MHQRAALSCGPCGVGVVGVQEEQQQQQHRLARPKLPKPMREPPSSPVHESATAQQIEDTPMGTLAHRNYQCPSLNGERARHAPDAMQQRAARSAEGNLAFERALHPSLDHIVPWNPEMGSRGP